MVTESKTTTIHPRSLGAGKTTLRLAEIEKIKRCENCRFRLFKNGYCDIKKESVKKDYYCEKFSRLV